MKNILKRVVSVCTVVALMATMFVSTASSASAISYSGSSSYRSGKYYTALKNVPRTGNQRTDIVNVAKSQVGYQEGSNSSSLSGQVRGSGNCTEYGRWYGFHDMWCAMFVSWCANVAGVSTSVVPKHCFTPSGLSWFKNRGRAYSRSTVANGGYRPQPGDIIYFKSSRNNNTTNHVGIVTSYSGSTVYTVEGNTSSATISTNGGAVAAKSYSIYNTYIVYICKPNYSGTSISSSSSSSSSSSTASAGYYPACSSSCPSIIDALDAMGVDSSKSYRAVIAAANGIEGYTGTADQNIYLLKICKQGKLKKPASSSSSSSSSSSTSSSSSSTSSGRKKATAAQMEVIRKIIYAVETGGQVYGRADYGNFTEAYTNTSNEHAITIGAGQWYATEAKTLLNLIRKTAPSTFKSLDTAGIASDLDNKNWSTYRISKTSAKAKCISRIISTDIGKKCQDQLIDEQMELYMDYAYDLGVTDIDAQMMCANYRHHGGTGAVKRILGKTSKPYTLDKLYASSKTDTGNQVGAYRSRQNMVYNSLKKYIKNSEATTTTGTTSSSTTTTSGNTTAGGVTISSANKKFVFNATYYANKYSDLKATYGTDATKLYEHFLVHGIKEGRCASPNFDVKYYLGHTSNKDLVNAFGAKNYEAALEHYLTYGIKEGRPSHPTFNVKKYVSLYSDLKAAFKTDYKALTNHYIDHGVAEGRVGIESSTPVTETKPKPTDELAAAEPQYLGKAFSAVITNVGVNKRISSTNGDNAVTYTISDGLKQRWIFNLQSDGSYEIKNANYSKCLHVTGASSENGAVVKSYKDNNNKAQRWFIYKLNGYYVLRSACSTKNVLTVKNGGTANKTALVMNTYTGGDIQLFKITKEVHSKYKDLGDKFTATIYNCNAKKNLSIYDESNIITYPASSSDAQKWVFTRQSDGTYEIKNVKYNKLLSVKSNSSKSGANIELAKDANAKGQRWQLCYLGYSRYVLRPTCSSNTVMCIEDSSKESEANVETAKYTGKYATCFEINVIK